jgi:hypothetical protein
MAIYAADGSINVVDDSGTGRYSAAGKLRVTEATVELGVNAPDGSVYVEVVSEDDLPYGLYNARGNIRVVNAGTDGNKGFYANNGAMRVTGLVAATIVAGNPMGLLLVLTYPATP